MEENWFSTVCRDETIRGNCGRYKVDNGSMRHGVSGTGGAHPPNELSDLPFAPGVSNIYFYTLTILRPQRWVPLTGKYFISQKMFFQPFKLTENFRASVATSHRDQNCIIRLWKARYSILLLLLLNLFLNIRYSRKIFFA